MLPVKRDSFISSFLVCGLLLILFYLYTLTNNSGMMLSNKSQRKLLSCPDLRWKVLSLSFLSIVLAVCFHFKSLIRLWKFHPITSLLRIIMNEFCTFFPMIFCISWSDYVISQLSIVHIVDCIDLFFNISVALHFIDEFKLIMLYYSFIYC